MLLIWTKNPKKTVLTSVNAETRKIRRFAEVENKDLDAIVEKFSSKTHKRSNKMGSFLFTEWSKQKALGVSLAEMTVQELDKSLRQFYAEARNKEGGNYSRATLLSLRNGIERYLNTPPLSTGIKFNADPRFVLSNQMLDAKIKELKKERPAKYNPQASDRKGRPAKAQNQ
ncbi:hypothetical protein ACROYT_G029302 [Oculina patagonica]